MNNKQTPDTCHKCGRMLYDGQVWGGIKYDLIDWKKKYGMLCTQCVASDQIKREMKNGSRKRKKT